MCYDSPCSFVGMFNLNLWGGENMSSIADISTIGHSNRRGSVVF